jgi:hypothetical protein
VCHRWPLLNVSALRAAPLRRLAHKSLYATCPSTQVGKLEAATVFMHPTFATRSQPTATHRARPSACLVLEGAHRAHTLQAATTAAASSSAAARTAARCCTTIDRRGSWTSVTTHLQIKHMSGNTPGPEEQLTTQAAALDLFANVQETHCHSGSVACFCVSLATFSGHVRSASDKTGPKRQQKRTTIEGAKNTAQTRRPAHPSPVFCHQRSPARDARRTSVRDER